MNNPPSSAIRPILSPGGENVKEGLVTIATYTDQTDLTLGDRVGTIQYISEGASGTEFPVYSVDFYYPEILGFPDLQNPEFADLVQVSDAGNHSADEYHWDLGPNSAMRGGDITVCAWTRRVLDPEGGYTVYDIMGDHDY